MKKIPCIIQTEASIPDVLHKLEADGKTIRRLAVICEQAPLPAESFIRRDLKELEKEYDVKVFGLRRRVPTLKNFRSIFGHPTASFLQLSFRLRTINDVADYVKDGGVIIAHFAWTTADIASVASKISGRKWICCVHAWDVFSEIPASQLEDRLRTASKVIACSKAAADATVAAGVEQNKVSVVRHSLDMEKIKNAMRTTGQRNQKKVCAVGRLVPKKGFDILIGAWPEILSKIPDAELEIIGDGPLAHQLKTMAKPYSDSIHFAGKQNEDTTLRHMAESGLFVLPSRRMPDGDRDGISNAVVEALALGIPVITTDAGAAGEVIEPDKLLHTPVTPTALADAIIEQLSGHRTASAKPSRKLCANNSATDSAVPQCVLHLRGWDNAQPSRLRGNL